jgi:putative DNA primase/helicase
VVEALPRDASGRGWGRLTRIIDPDGRVHRWAIPAKLFAGTGDEVRGGLLDLGLQLASGSKARAALSDLLRQWRAKTRATTAERLGWADASCTAFVLGDGRVLGDENVVYQSEHAPGAAREMRGAGALDDWKSSVAALCVGNSLLVAGVSIAFSGPLLEPLGFEGGGLHLRGASSRGKSTVLRTAVSVWGSRYCVQTWRATANGLEGIALACNSSILALDELGEIDSKEAGRAAYMLPNGGGKVRGAPSGQARPSARWCVPVLSSGEVSLADKMAEGRERARAGQEVRLLDIVADRQAHGAFDHLHGMPDGAAFADHLNRAAAGTYGTAGPAFVEALLTDFEQNLDDIRAAVGEFRTAAAARFHIAEADGQVARAVKRLSLIAAAGEAATRFGLTGWQPGTARDAALDVLGLWLEGRGGAGPAEAREAIERTRAFVVSHGASRFQWMYDKFDGREKVVNQAGWRDDDYFYIATDPWHREVHAGSDPSRAAKHLLEAGLLTCNNNRGYKYRMPRGLPSRPSVYAVKAEIIGFDGDG